VSVERGVLTVTLIEYFGRLTVRPECPLSRGLAALLRQKTLTGEDVELIKRLGFRVKTKEGNEL